MKAKEIHDLLLSLLVRGLGFWLLYGALVGGPLDGIEKSIYLTFAPDRTPNPDVPQWGDIYYFVVQLLPAIYLITGAPPFPKWATHSSCRPPGDRVD